MSSLKSGVPLVRALERGLSLLAAFSPEAPKQLLSQLARSTRLDTGTTRRLLQTLMNQNFIGYDESTSQYYLTHKVLELGAAVRVENGIKDVGAVHLRRLADETSATAFLWLYSEGQALCIDRVKASIPNVDAAWFAVGARTALNNGGGPRVLLAYLSEPERDRALAQTMMSRTAASTVDRSELAKAAELIRARGWDLAVDDFVIGLAGLGVPILDRRGTLAGSLSVSTLTTAFGNRRRPNHLDKLQAAARAIGDQL